MSEKPDLTRTKAPNCSTGIDSHDDIHPFSDEYNASFDSDSIWSSGIAPAPVDPHRDPNPASSADLLRAEGDSGPQSWRKSEFQHPCNARYRCLQAERRAQMPNDSVLCESDRMKHRRH